VNVHDLSIVIVDRPPDRFHPVLRLEERREITDAQAGTGASVAAALKQASASG
jgi:hypothetical protein